MKKNNKTFRLVAMAVLTALVVVLQTVASSIRIGPIPMSFTMIPIAVGAILFGPGAGAALGGVFGVVCLIAGITGTDAGTFLLLAATPLWTGLVCVGKGIACGAAAGTVYRLCAQKKTLGCLLAALTAPIVNTGIFAVAMLTVMRGSLVEFAAGQDAVYYLFISIIGINFLVELAVNASVSAGIARIVQAVSRRCS